VNLELFPSAEEHPLQFERRLQRQGYKVVAGIDEAGRGPLAGPVLAAAVVLPEHFDLPGLTDSKKLSPVARERLFPLIRQQALSVGIGLASPGEIDQLNILQATLRAMMRAVDRLALDPDYLLIDGITPLPHSLPQQTLKKGRSSFSRLRFCRAQGLRQRRPSPGHCRPRSLPDSPGFLSWSQGISASPYRSLIRVLHVTLSVGMQCSFKVLIPSYLRLPLLYRL
jgi:hypothetical protein